MYRLQTNTQVFYSPDALPPTNSVEALRENMTHSNNHTPGTSLPGFSWKMAVKMERKEWFYQVCALGQFEIRFHNWTAE